MRLAVGMLAVLLGSSVAAANDDAPTRIEERAADAVSSAPARSKVSVRVVRILPETNQALLYDRSGGGTHLLVTVGEKAGGYTVEAIDGDEVTLSANGQQIVLAAPERPWRRRTGAERPSAERPQLVRGGELAPIARPQAVRGDEPAPVEPPQAVRGGGSAPADPYGGPADPREAAGTSASASSTPTVGAPAGSAPSMGSPGPADPYEVEIREVTAPSWIDPASLTPRAVTAPALAPTAPTAIPVASSAITTSSSATPSGAATSIALPVPARTTSAAATTGPQIIGPAASPIGPTAAAGATTAPAIRPAAVAGATTAPAIGPTPAGATTATAGGAATASGAAVAEAAGAPGVRGGAAVAGAAARGGEVVLARREVEAALADFGAMAGAFRASFTPAGVKVEEVVDGSLFAKAGLRAGDVIATVEGRPLRSLDDVAALYARAGALRVITAQVVRGGQPLTLRAVVQ